MIVFCFVFVCPQGVLKGKPSRWTKTESSVKVPVYLDSHDNQDRLFGFLSAVLRVTDTQLPFTDPVRLIMDVLFPEVFLAYFFLFCFPALSTSIGLLLYIGVYFCTILFLKAITYGLQQLYSLSMREAEEVFHSGPPIDQR